MNLDVFTSFTLAPGNRGGPLILLTARRGGRLLAHREDGALSPASQPRSSPLRTSTDKIPHSCPISTLMARRCVLFFSGSPA